MSVPLGIGEGRKMISDPVLPTKCFEWPAVKLGPVVRHQYLGNAKTGYDVLPHELFGISVRDVCQRFCLYPFSKIICGHNKPLAVPRSSGERSYYIQTPLGEWPWACNRVKTGRRLVDRRSELLAFITTSLRIGLRPFGCKATNNLALWHGVPKIVPLCGLHIPFHESPIIDPK